MTRVNYSLLPPAVVTLIGTADRVTRSWRGKNDDGIARLMRELADAVEAVHGTGPAYPVALVAIVRDADTGAWLSEPHPIAGMQGEAAMPLTHSAGWAGRNITIAVGIPGRAAMSPPTQVLTVTDFPVRWSPVNSFLSFTWDVRDYAPFPKPPDWWYETTEPKR